MLDGALRTPDDFSFAAGIINKETERMIRLVHSLLELSKLESGQVKMAQDRVQIEEIVGDTLSSFEPQAQQQTVRFIKNLYPVPPMLGDQDRLRQVFNNLLDNALRYTPAGGSVTVSTRAANANIVITVSDTGQGIAPQDLPHIFERFYQADKSRSKEAGGLGLGLAICKEIIAAHQGKIEVNSMVGKGTTFTIILPATPLNFEQSPQTPTAEPVTRH
jgi:signal transduction histidine kinase